MGVINKQTRVLQSVATVIVHDVLSQDQRILKLYEMNYIFQVCYCIINELSFLFFFTKIIVIIDKA